MDSTLHLLRDLVAIDSVNPSLVPGAAGERHVADAYATDLRDAGLDVQLIEVAAGRPNVVAVLEGRAPGRTLLLCGHLDTVGVDGMDAPFTPVEREGRLYGRGAQDMKGGLAAIAGAARVLASSGGLTRGRLVVAGVIDEEYASLGADALVRDWRADAAVVTEPTGLQLAVAHKGFVWIEVGTVGRAAHGSRPEDGRDAIVRMGRVLAALEHVNRELRGRPPHPLVGTASLHASMIDGGREWSSYPDACRLRLERRTVSGETPETALGEVTSVLHALREADAEFDGHAQVAFARSPYEIDVRAEIVQAFIAVARGQGLDVTPKGVSFWTDAAILGTAGIPSVVFGPGGAGLHSVSEHVVMSDVLACRDALVRLAERFC
ncbi:MAG: M20/M25/M40 family metallo-hydrolase [Luteitalea sp.]|nr:M20/M25/M40 family metallo-hydrolase [Luteitalea sp.]